MNTTMLKAPSKPNRSKAASRSVSSSSPYNQAARILNEIWTKRKGLKSIVYDKDTGELTCSKQTYAQVCQVLKHKALLERLIKDSDASKIQAKNEGLLYVLLFELLLGPHKSIKGGGALKRQILKQEDDLRKHLQQYQEQNKTEKGVELGEEYVESPEFGFPRYIRINTLWPETLSLEKIISQLKQCIDDTSSNECYRDEHVPGLLVLPNNSSTLTSNLQLNDYLYPHRIVLQDKSSCFSALCMVQGYVDVTSRRVYLDACAAPGNKTSHLAALTQHELMKSHNKRQNEKENPPKLNIYALDRSQDRCSILQRRIQQLVPSPGDGEPQTRVKVEVKCQDFLQTPTPHAKELLSVTDILLDPSCSGSGIFMSLDRKHDNDAIDEELADGDKAKRLRSLSSFQLKALRHAMTAFPAVERIVYSTCSIHEIENESVVSRALAMDRSSSSSEWELVAPVCLQKWPCRGKSFEGLTQEESDCLIRVSGIEYETNGFFVACMQKRSKSELKASSTSKESMSVLEASLKKFDSKGNLLGWSNIPMYTGRKNIKREAKASAEVPPPVSEGTMSTGVLSAKPALPKKIAKKLEWKRRQREAKEERIRKKSRKS